MNIERTLLAGLTLTMLAVISVGLTAAQSSATQTLTVGFIGAGEGRQVERDQQFYQAAVLAAEQINAGDDDDVTGISSTNDNRYDLTIAYYKANSTSDAETALQDALNADAVAILGPHEKVLAQALVDKGTPGVPLLLGALDSPTSTRVFRLAASDEDRAKAAANYLVTERKFTRVGLVNANTDVALNGIETFKTTVGADVIVADLSHEADDLDFNGDAKTIRDSQAQAIFVWLLDDQTRALLDALRAANWDGVVLYAGLDTTFVQSMSDMESSTIIGPVNWSATAYDNSSQTFVNDYMARWGVKPNDEAAAYYDAVFMLAAAITEAGTSPESITSQLNTLDYKGVQGDYIDGKSDSLLLVQLQSSGEVIEAARYRQGECTTCPDTWWTDTTDDSVDKTGVFTLGLIATLDGAMATSGNQIEDAARLAIREINEAGGVIGNDGVRYTLDLRTYSVTSAEDAQNAYGQAVQDGAQIVLGPDFNGQIMPNLQNAASSEVAQLVSATDAQISSNEPANFVFQVRPTDKALVQAAANYLMDVRGLTRFASVAVRTDYGLDAIDAFADVVADTDDSQLTLRLEHNVDETDFASTAEQIAASSAEAVVVWSTQPAAQLLLVELQKLNWEGVFVYGYLTSDFISNLPADSGIEVLGPVNWWSNAQDWVSQDFEARFQARYSDAPAPQSAAYYDAVYLIGHAIEATNAEPVNIQKWLAEQDIFTGVQGQYKASSYGNGELIRSSLIIGVQDGVAHELARYDGLTCLTGCNP